MTLIENPAATAEIVIGALLLAGGLGLGIYAIIDFLNQEGGSPPVNAILMAVAAILAFVIGVVLMIKYARRFKQKPPGSANAPVASKINSKE